MSDVDPELFASVIALQHADWLGLVLGALQRGTGSTLDADTVLEGINQLDEGRPTDRAHARTHLLG